MAYLIKRQKAAVLPGMDAIFEMTFPEASNLTIIGQFAEEE